jgi:UDP-3-O-[3-hydroxymyristoyl] glucosamine N-acyltransferase
LAITYDGIRIFLEDLKAFVKVKDADLAMVVLLKAFELESPYFEIGIHPTVVIDKIVKLGNGSKIVMNSYLGKNAIIYHNASAFDDSINRS